MKNLRNQVQLIGRLGQDPRVKTFDNDRKLVSFSIATHESYKNANGEKVEDTQWHNIVIWGKLANLAEQLLEKGKEVALGGKLNHRTYADNDGITKHRTEIIAHDFQVLSPKSA